MAKRVANNTMYALKRIDKKIMKINEKKFKMIE